MSTPEKGKSVAELAALVGGRVISDRNVVIQRIADFELAEGDAITFVDDAKLLNQASHSRAGCLIVPEGTKLEVQCCIEVAHPRLAFAIIAEALHPPKRHEAAIHPTTVLAASAKIDRSAFIDARVFIGERTHVGAETQIYAGAVIGDDAYVGHACIIHPNVVLCAGSTLGDRVIVHAGAVIGADGFGYVRDPAKATYRKFPHIGTVVVEDDVEIGANTCIDRGALGETRIGRGTKIDNLVQIAHNVRIGERVIIAAQTGISGSTVIEDDCVIGGQVGMGDHARVERGAIIGSKAGVLPGKIVRAGSVQWGVPVRPLEEYKRLNAHFGRLPQMREEIENLRRQIKELVGRFEGDS